MIWIILIILFFIFVTNTGKGNIFLELDNGKQVCILDVYNIFDTKDIILSLG